MSYPTLKRLGFRVRRSYLQSRGYRFSTGVNFRGSHGIPIQNILRGIHIPIQDRAAFRTNPVTVREFQILIDESAMNTTLARREEPVNLLDMATIPAVFVLKLPDKFRPAGITDRLGKVVVLHHSFDVQILNNDKLIRFHQLPAKFVSKVKALVGYLFVKFSHLQPSLVPAIAAFLRLAQFALVSGKAASGLAQVFRIGEPLAVTGNGKVLKSQVKPYLPTLIHWIVNLLFYLNRGEILTALGSRYGKVFHNALNRAMQDDLDPTNFRNIQLVTVNPETLRKPAGLLTVFLFELRELSPFIKEVAVSGIKITKGLLCGLRIYVLKPGVIRLLFEFCKLQGGIVIGQALAGFGIVVNALAEKVVIDKAHRAELLRQIALLLAIWVDSVFVSTFDIHSYKYTTFCVRKQTCSKERTSPYIPGLKHLGFTG